MLIDGSWRASGTRSSQAGFADAIARLARVRVHYAAARSPTIALLLGPTNLGANWADFLQFECLAGGPTHRTLI